MIDPKDIDFIRRQLAKMKWWGLIKYEKPLEKFNKRDNRDLISHYILVKNGYSPIVLTESAPEGYSNIDLLVDNEYYEIKSPISKKISSVEDAFKKAKKQFDNAYPKPVLSKKVILNLTYSEIEDQGDILGAIKRRALQHGINEVIIIDKSQKLIRLTIQKRGDSFLYSQDDATSIGTIIVPH